MIINEEAVLGSLVFAAIKLVGYRFAVKRVVRYYPTNTYAAPLVVALSRMVLGGLFAWPVASTFDVHKTLPWYGVLVLMRILEWGLVFWYFYERPAGAIHWRRLALFAGFGTVVSCVLDLPAAFSALIVPLMVYGFC